MFRFAMQPRHAVLCALMIEARHQADCAALQDDREVLGFSLLHNALLSEDCM